MKPDAAFVADRIEDALDAEIRLYEVNGSRRVQPIPLHTSSATASLQTINAEDRNPLYGVEPTPAPLRPDDGAHLRPHRSCVSAPGGTQGISSRNA